MGDITLTGLSVEPLVRSGLHGIVWVEVLGAVRERGLARLEQAKRQVDEWREQAATSAIRMG